MLWREIDECWNRKLQCAVFYAALKVLRMAKMIEDNKELNSSTVVVAAAIAVTASENKMYHSLITYESLNN